MNVPDFDLPAPVAARPATAAPSAAPEAAPPEGPARFDRVLARERATPRNRPEGNPRPAARDHDAIGPKEATGKVAHPARTHGAERRGAEDSDDGREARTADGSTATDGTATAATSVPDAPVVAVAVGAVAAPAADGEAIDGETTVGAVTAAGKGDPGTAEGAVPTVPAPGVGKEEAAGAAPTETAKAGTVSGPTGSTDSADASAAPEEAPKAPATPAPDAGKPVPVRADAATAASSNPAPATPTPPADPGAGRTDRPEAAAPAPAESAAAAAAKATTDAAKPTEAKPVPARSGAPRGAGHVLRAHGGATDPGPDGTAPAPGDRPATPAGLARAVTQAAPAATPGLQRALEAVAGTEGEKGGPSGVARTDALHGGPGGPDRAVPSAPEAKVPAPAAAPEVFDQVIDRSVRMARLGEREATLRLVPEHLGEVKIHIAMDRGNVVADLTVHNHQARHLLETHQARLQQALVDAGADGARVNVSLGGEQTAGHSRPDRQASGGPAVPVIPTEDGTEAVVTPAPAVAAGPWRGTGALSIRA